MANIDNACQADVGQLAGCSAPGTRLCRVGLSCRQAKLTAAQMPSRYVEQALPLDSCIKDHDKDFRHIAGVDGFEVSLHTATPAHFFIRTE
jgi:hypothetical protein